VLVPMVRQGEVGSPVAVVSLPGRRAAAGPRRAGLELAECAPHG
jgi:hypothetical protein